MLRRSGVTSSKQWAGFSDEKKKKYPDTLVDILDNASLPQDMLFVLQYKNFDNQ
jgi:hypothetical protein